VHLLEVGYSDCTYGYNKRWKWPSWAWDYITEAPYIHLMWLVEPLVQIHCTTCRYTGTFRSSCIYRMASAINTTVTLRGARMGTRVVLNNQHLPSHPYTSRNGGKGNHVSKSRSQILTVKLKLLLSRATAVGSIKPSSAV